MMPPSQSSRQVGETLVLPLLRLCGGDNLSYLNHIIIAHYHAGYGCGKCLKQAFVSSSALHNHKKVCIRLVPRKSTGGSGGKPSSSEEAMAATGALPRLPTRRTARLLPLTPRAPVPFLLPRHHHTTVDKRHPAITSPTRTRRTQVRRRKRRRMRALPGRAPATRHVKTVAATRPTSAYSAIAMPMSSNSCILSINDFVT